jgi:ribosomal protein S12 methylthiotransferase accessory factor
VIEALPHQLRRAVSPYVGIVRSLEECLPAATEPRLFQAVCEVGNGAGVIGSPLGHLSGVGGAARVRSAAAAAAVGEALERYSASYVPQSHLTFASARELGDEAVAPERFALFSERQYRQSRFPFRRFTADARVAWVRGRELPGGRSVLLPAELVFLGDARAGGEPPIGDATSSGLACADDPGEATFRALCELLERDAFMITWANRLSLPLLEPGAAASAAADDRELFRPTGLRYAAVDLSAFHHVPSVLGVVRGPVGATGALGVGAGTAATVEQAWSKALSEAFAARTAGVKLRLLDSTRNAGEGDDGVRSFDDHIRYHADPGNAGAARFLDAGELRRPLASVAPLEGRTTHERIDALCARVRSAGASAYAVDATAPDVARLGVFVIRVVAPELCALDALHAARHLGGRRLYEAAVAAGLRDRPLREADVNPEPHPFP